MVKCLHVLAERVADENGELLSRAPAPVSAVLLACGPKHVALMRELCFVCHPPDATAVASLMKGLPTFGWAPPAFGLLERVKPF